MDNNTNAAAFPPGSPAALMIMAMERGANVTEAQAMAQDQTAWIANQARLAFQADFLAFKGESVHIVKNTLASNDSGEWMYADYPTVLAAVTAPLAKHNITATCPISRDEPEWIEVTCELRHTGGHIERNSMGSPPSNDEDLTPAQNRAATASLLQRHLLKTACGVAEESEEFASGGIDKKQMLREGWVERAAKAANDPEVRRIAKDGEKAFRNARDNEGYTVFAAAVQARREAIKAGKQVRHG